MLNFAAGFIAGVVITPFLLLVVAITWLAIRGDTLDYGEDEHAEHLGIGALHGAGK